MQGASLRKAKLHGANLTADADLRGVAKLTVEQLCTAYIDETTQLDPHLANDPRIKTRIAELAEQNQSTETENNE